VTRDLRLRGIKRRADIADTEFSHLAEQKHDAETRVVRKRLEKLKRREKKDHGVPENGKSRNKDV
jgi:hypothetical protein